MTEPEQLPATSSTPPPGDDPPRSRGSADPDWREGTESRKPPDNAWPADAPTYKEVFEDRKSAAGIAAGVGLVTLAAIGAWTVQSMPGLAAAPKLEAQAVVPWTTLTISHAVIALGGVWFAYQCFRFAERLLWPPWADGTRTPSGGAQTPIDELVKVIRLVLEKK